MQIIKSTEPIPVEHPVFCIFGQPGIGKSSLGYSAADPLLLDVDQGAHRAVNRRDTLKIGSWTDVAELTENRQALEPYKTLVVDTVGRLLDLLAADIIEQNPKYARDGALTLQGFGVLKTRFRQWMALLRTMGKDVILLSHHKEEKDGDLTIVRPDIIGASYGEVMKLADFVGFLAMVGKQRVLDFSPTDRWVGKNPAQWKPIIIPPADKATHVLAQLMTQGRAALGQISAQSAAVADHVQDWKAAIESFATAEDVNRAAKALESMPEIVRAQLRPVFKAKVETLGVRYDKATKVYVDRAPAPVVVPVPTADEMVW